MSALHLSTVVVVLVFAICWAPFHIDRLLWSFITSWTDHMHNIFEYVHIISGVLFYLSSAVNPIIYNLLSSRFRERFKELVCRPLPSSSSRNDSVPFSIINKDPSTNAQRLGWPQGSPHPFVIMTEKTEKWMRHGSEVEGGWMQEDLNV